MIRAVAFAVIVAFALAALIASEHAAPNAGLPVVKAGFPVEHRDIIPWMLNTRCEINSRNLPIRNPQETV